jgi:hypothetical protein
MPSVMEIAVVAPVAHVGRGTALVPQLNEALKPRGREGLTEAQHRDLRRRPRIFPEASLVGYEFGSTTFATTQRCLPILRSRANPSLSYVDRAP